jgi:hypothetical protein
MEQGESREIRLGLGQLLESHHPEVSVGNDVSEP